MIKKILSKEDKKDWEDFLNNTSQVPDKDILNYDKINKQKIFKFDFHGYSIDRANKKVHEIITSCYNKGIPEVLFITGKGNHSQKKENIYVSNELSILKNTIPDFIENNSELKSKINQIKEAEKNLGGSGALLIRLKKL